MVFSSDRQLVEHRPVQRAFRTWYEAACEFVKDLVLCNKTNSDLASRSAPS